MTTFNFTGITVTSSGGVASAVTNSTLALSGSENLTVKFLPTVAGGSATAFAAATMTISVYQRVFSVAANGTRVDPTTALSIAEYEWTESGVDKSALVLRVDTGVANTYSYYVLKGDNFPTFSSAANYQSFLSGVTVSSNSIPNQYLYVSQTDSNGAPTVADSIVHADNIVGGFTDNWSTAATALKTGFGNDTVIGLATADIIYAGVGLDSIVGNAGNDAIYLEAGDDFGSGGDGNDAINGGSGNDYINGGLGDDKLNAGTGNDTVYGAEGNDSIIGDLGNDYLVGGVGNDTVLGGDGADTVFGLDGNDSLRAGTGNDNVDGGFGNDTLLGESGNDTLDGHHGDDRLDGAAGNDFLFGDSGMDTLLGGTGSDTLQGGADADVLNGGDGVDYVNGGTGADTVSGGAGSDFFVFNEGDGADTFLDFRNNIDTLRLDSTLAANWAAVQAAATQNGANVVLNFGDGDSITIRNITVAQLSDDIAFI